MSGFRHKRTYGLFILLFFLFLHIVLVSAAGAITRIMPLGDSITWDDRIEAGGDNRDDGDRIAYRYSLWQLLTDAGYDFDFVGSEYTGFDTFPDAENEGHPGWTDDDIAASVYDFLLDNPADIILLHIGTNMLDPDTTGVENILDEIDRYEADFGNENNRHPCPDRQQGPIQMQRLQLYNDNVEDMAFSRVNDPTDPAFPDNIIFGPDVDMEDGAGIDYRLVTDDPPGDMWDFLHPAVSGYSKMADVWFSALMEILPQADAGPDQYVYEFDTVTLRCIRINGSLWATICPTIGLQTAGSTVALSDDQTAQATFDAPGVTDSDGSPSTPTVRVDNEGLLNRLTPVRHPCVEKQ